MRRKPRAFSLAVRSDNRVFGFMDSMQEQSFVDIDYLKIIILYYAHPVKSAKNTGYTSKFCKGGERGMGKKPDQEWHTLSEEVLTGMKERQLQRPRATLQEQAFHERMARLEARMLQDMAFACNRKRWRASSERCPLLPRGRRSSC